MRDDPAGKRANEGSGEPNVTQLRSHIDAGRSGDKVSAPDPAAAPLDTDAEAGDVAPTPGEVGAEQRRHREGSAQTSPSHRYPARPSRPT
ncbi:hypothetical protein ABIE65_004696 [Constrictibacter sp. MBR-5]|jgi:hypothetical protein|uniref:hypothetical protein n=1 Tax=Constrictibacter sp. MBR-5 TaxID=3156467 RepID=UPI0033956626